MAATTHLSKPHHYQTCTFNPQFLLHQEPVDLGLPTVALVDRNGSAPSQPMDVDGFGEGGGEESKPAAAPAAAAARPESRTDESFLASATEGAAPAREPALTLTGIVQPMEEEGAAYETSPGAPGAGLPVATTPAPGQPDAAEQGFFPADLAQAAGTAAGDQAVIPDAEEVRQAVADAAPSQDLIGQAQG